MEKTFLYQRKESIPPGPMGTYWRGGSGEVWELGAQVHAGWRYLGHRGLWETRTFGPVTDENVATATAWIDEQVEELAFYGPLVIVWAEDDPDYCEDEGVSA